jgi:TetR/AcrR family transcriptional repressor of nem operon
MERRRVSVNARVDRRERSHERILVSASRLLRARGISGARVADVMEGAGLTVGGFYAHFDSKDALVAAALRRTAAETRARLFQRLDESPAGGRVEVVLKRYLCAAHRDAPAEGCPLPAVVGEVGAAAPEHGAVVGEQIEAMARELEAIFPADRAIPGHARALGLVALMYGGLSLSRALRGTAVSDEVLKACRTLGACAARCGAKT